MSLPSSFSHTASSTGGDQPDGLALAVAAYRLADESARQLRDQDAAGDAAQLTATLARLNITPILLGDRDELGWDEPFHVEADGTVTTLIAHPTWAYGTGGSAVVQGRYVWACARQGWQWLRASDDHGHAVGEAGPLETLADVGRALLHGPLTMPAPDPEDRIDHARSFADRATDPQTSTDTREICASLTGLTHAVLTVAEHLATASDDLSADLASLADGADPAEAAAAAARSQWWRR